MAKIDLPDLRRFMSADIAGVREKRKEEEDPDAYRKMLEAALRRTDWGEVEREKGDGGQARNGVHRVLASYPPIQDRLDLHRLCVEAAKGEVLTFIGDAKERGFLTLLIITGKGNRSRGGVAILKPAIQRMLEQLKKQQAIFDFYEDNGGGSFTVYLPREK